MKTSEIQKLSDSELYQKCKEYGTNARLWLRKFAGLLPEVERRKLYKKKSYASIYEFAARLAGMNHDTVNRILRLDKRLEDKPVLREKLTSGAASWTKIEKVSYIATSETEKEWSEKIDNLSQPALETYVAEVRKGNGEKSVLQNTFLPENSSLLQKTISFKVTEKFELRLRFLKQRLEKEKKNVLTFQEVFEELMNSYNKKQKVTDKTRVRKVVQLCPDCAKRKQLEQEAENGVTRHIPANIRKIIDDRSQGKCEFEDCDKPKEIYHHTKRFALQKSHNPDFIVALCKNHERLFHAGLIENEEASPKNWKIRPQPETDGYKFFIDRLVQRYQQEPFPPS